MTFLLVAKESIKEFYTKFQYPVEVAFRMLVTFLMLLSINAKIGYMPALQNIPLLLLVSVVCGFLTPAIIVMVEFVFIIANLYSLSMEVSAVAFIIILIISLLFIRFSRKSILLLAIVPIAFFLKIQYIVPLIVGIFMLPSATFSMACGVLIYSMMNVASMNAVAIRGLKNSQFFEKINIFLEGITSDKNLYLYLFSFIVVSLIVYAMKKSAVDYAFAIAISFGAISNMILLLLGDLLYNIDVNLFLAIISMVISAVIVYVMHFFYLGIDYKRVERVQFEDDEYYYYVKAVPKMNISATSKTVKQISSKTQKNIKK